MFFMLGIIFALVPNSTLFFAFFGSIPLAIILLIVTIALGWQGYAYSRNCGLTGIDLWKTVLATPVLIVCAILMALPMTWMGSRVGTAAVLAVSQSHFSSIIKNARLMKRDGNGENYTTYLKDDGVTYIVDFGPPVRVAFNPEGFLDNWNGIVFDPSGDVAKARGFNPVSGKFFAPENITNLFGGDLVQCRPYWGDFYECSFT
jgi:hypothetical protein